MLPRSLLYVNHISLGYAPEGEPFTVRGFTEDNNRLLYLLAVPRLPVSLFRVDAKGLNAWDNVGRIPIGGVAELDGEKLWFLEEYL